MLIQNGRKGIVYRFRRDVAEKLMHLVVVSALEETFSLDCALGEPLISRSGEQIYACRNKSDKGGKQ